MSQAIVTGGSGFVGTHLIQHLLGKDQYKKIINVDIQAPQSGYEADSRVIYLNADVREELPVSSFVKHGCDSDTVIFNLAAICRIPGYPDIDYFRTNIQGAENVCRLANALGCDRIVFTSSISPYGASEELKTEESVPQPDNPYGSSKLVAEYIHKGWFEQDPDNRHLTILRPGIIFGPNEQANFTRLYNSLKSGFFAYPGRRDTKKACIYVKDVARALDFFMVETSGYQLLNLVYEEPPSIETICDTLTNYTDTGKARIVMPASILLATAHIIRILGNIINKDFSGIHPDRVKKVMISTNVSGKKLAQTPFKLKYSLSDGIKDWFKECGNTLY